MSPKPSKTNEVPFGSLSIEKMNKISIWGLEQLWTAVIDTEVDFDPRSTKSELRALIFLYQLGLLKKNDIPNAAFLKQVAAWCNPLPFFGPLTILGSDARFKDLGELESRWKCIGVLVKVAIEEGTSPTSIDESRPGRLFTLASYIPTPAEANLLLACIHADAVGSGTIHCIPNCPIDKIVSPLQLLPLLKKLPTFDTPEELEEARTDCSLAGDLLEWICNTFDGELKEATGSLKISAMPDSVQQFVVPNPCPALEEAFQKRKALAGGRSTLLFHGTRLCNLLSILRTGLRPPRRHEPGGYIWMAEDPAVSYFHALQERAISDSATGPQSIVDAMLGQDFPHLLPFISGQRSQKASLWKGSVHDGVLLGCEVVGNGQLARDLGMPNWSEYDTNEHAISRTDDVMVRYVFIIPSSHCKNPRKYFPEPAARSAVEGAMLEGFRAMHSCEM